MGIRVVKSFVREDYEIKKFEKVSTEIYKLFSKAERLISLNQPIMMLCIDLVLILIAWIGSKLIITTNSVALTTGELTSMISYGMQILMSLKL